MHVIDDSKIGLISSRLTGRYTLASFQYLLHSKTGVSRRNKASLGKCDEHNDRWPVHVLVYSTILSSRMGQIIAETPVDVHSAWLESCKSFKACGYRLLSKSG